MRHVALLIITLGLCFVVGFGLGAYPHFWDKMMGREDQRLVILIVSDQASLPKNLAQTFSDETGYALQIQEVKTPNLFLSDAQGANLLYAPWEWFDASASQLHPWTDQLWSQLFSDFQSTDIFKQKFFPLFWMLKTDDDGKKQMHFEGLATLHEPSEGTRYFLGFLMEHEELMREWTRNKQMASTLKKAEAWKDFPESLKPQTVRANPLATISIKENPAGDAAPPPPVNKAKPNK